MAETSMNKAIHGAFRRDLDRFVCALSAFRPGDTMRASQLGTAWANVDDQLTHHHESEHAIAWPALQSVGVRAAVNRDVPGPVLAVIGGVFGRGYRKDVAPVCRA